jgi:hypothetical protein
MLSAAEAATAANRGWQVCEVYDLTAKALRLQILPTDFGRMSSQQALSVVMEQAKMHDGLAIKALTLVARSNVYKRNGKSK